LIDVRVVEPGEHLDELADVLFDCVDGGASVGYMAPFTRDDARAAMAGFADGRRVVLAAFDGDALVGTAQLVPAAMPNQPHRGDVAKVLVHRSARGKGVATKLMERIEAEAAARGITLLVLDTVTDSSAYRLYSRLGWQRVGPVPNYALMPDGAPCETTFFYKELS
jgi:GNAT superfamily N-acetyltransferase